MAPLSQRRHVSHQQHENVVLTDYAMKCVTQLEVLKQLATTSRQSHFRGEKEAVLIQVMLHVEDSIIMLKNWRADVLKGQQTSDDGIVQNVTDQFKQLEGHIIDAHDALNRRLLLRVLCWSVASQKRQQEASAHVTRALIEIGRDVEHLRGESLVVVIGTDDQHVHNSAVSEALHPTSGSYLKFQEALRTMPPSKEQSGTPGFLPIFWDELPHKSNLTSEFIYYSFFAGDGIIYTAAELEKAENVLTEYYDAWSELATQTNPIFPDRLPMVQSLANTSKICLVLKGMERPELLVHFFRCEQANVELPLPEQHLQTILKGNQYASVFAVEQYRVVRRPWNEGGHIEIPQREPLPLLFTHDYPSGSFGTVQCYTDVDSQERYARKEQITHDAEEHLTRERARLQKVNHRHVVQFVKSYRRGNCIGLLLKPAADGDLTLLLKTFNSGEMGQKLRPVILTAFGCLSHGLCHIHGRKIRHKDIKPNNILYRGSQDVARFLWADFGLAHDFGKSVDSRTFNASSYSARYAAPESVGSDQAVMDTEAAGLDDIHTTQDTNEEHEPSATAEPLQENAESPKLPAHGRSTDIFSYGCVFIEILSNLVNSKIPQSDTHGFAFCEHIEILQGWARDHAEPLDPADPLRVLFSLTARMIEHNAKKRPKVEEVVSVLVHSSTPEQFFCAACLPEARGESAAWLVAHETRQNNGGRISGESASIMSETSCLELEDEESGLPAEPVSQARFLSPAAAAKPRPAVRQSSSRLHQNEDEKSISEPRH